MATKVIYVSKGGNDGWDGLASITPKLTLAGAKAILQAGENTVYVGVGEYTAITGWDTEGNFVDIIGDYNGAIFGGGAGTVKQTNSGSFVLSMVRSISRMTLKLSAVSKYFIYGSTISATQYLTFNYVIFDAAASCTLIYSTKGTNYDVDFNKTTFNYCSLATTAIAFGNNWTFPIVFNNFDNITNGIALSTLYPACDILFSAASLLWGGVIAQTGMLGNFVFSGGTLKQSAASSGFFGTSINFLNGCKGNILVRNCSFLDNVAAAINLNTNQYLSRISIAFDYGCVNVIKGVFDCSPYALFDNVNSNGKKVYFFANGRMYEVDTPYNSKAVYWHNYTANAATFHLLPIENLAVSTEYDLTFNYKKMKNSASADYDIRFGVLKGSQMISHDLRDNSGNALIWADYLSSAHTYDAWYNKVLTFTTTANNWDTYFLVYYTPIAEYNFKLSNPEAL